MTYDSTAIYFIGMKTKLGILNTLQEKFNTKVFSQI